VDQQPGTATVKETTSLAQLLNVQGIEASVKGQRPALPSIPTKMVKNLTDGLRPPSDLYHLANAGSFHEIEAPPN
jgi:hypothetical protein